MWVQPVPSVSGPTPVPWAPGQALSLQQTPPSQSWSWAVPPDNQGPGTTFRPESRKPQDPQEDAVRPQALEATLSLWTRHSRHHTQLAGSSQQDRRAGNVWELLHLGRISSDIQEPEAGFGEP